MRPATALYQLTTRPTTFLRNNLLKISGASTSQQRNYRLGTHCNPLTGIGAPNESFTFEPQQLTTTDSIAVQVYNVEMIRNSSPFNPQAIPAFRLGGAASVMVTGQLSDCTFCIRGPANAPFVSHIQPRPGDNLSAVALHNEILNNGRFAGQPAGISASYGRSTTGGPNHKRYPAYAYVVGVRVGGNWQFYGQEVTGSRGPIINVVRIF